MERAKLEAARAARGARAMLFVVITAICVMHVGHAYGAGIAALMVSKSIPEATIAVIDPESGTSSGGSTGTDVRISPGDVILFRINYFAMPDSVANGINAYITEFIPPNTEVVGVRLVDPTSLGTYPGGLTMPVRYPGLAHDENTSGGGGGFTLPCTIGSPGCSATGTRSVPKGALTQLYGDTGLFYSTDTRTRRTPSTQFLTYYNGQLMIDDPRYATNIAPIVGLDGVTTFYGHTAWDVDQIYAYGIPNGSGPSGNRSDNQGYQETPFGYGSPVAGPQTHYQFEATDLTTGGADPETEVFFDNRVGPWNRIVYPGSTIAFGTTADFTNTDRRRVLPAPGAPPSHDLTPSSPLPTTTTAVRAAIGELRAGEAGILEVALRVRGTPLDPVHMRDVNCAESYGGAPATGSIGGGGLDNPWGYVIPSPACVFLNNQFDLTPSLALAGGGERITYTLHGKNLSTLPQTNVVVTADYDESRGMYVDGSATGGGGVTTCTTPAGTTRDCLSWNVGTLDPGEEYTFTFEFIVGGTGQLSLVSYGNYRSTELPAPGFTTQAVTLIRPTPLLRTRFTQPQAAIAANTNFTISGVIENWGTQSASLAGTLVTDPTTAILPAGWTLVSVTVGGTTGSTVLDARVSPTTPRTLPVTITARAPAGTAAGLYPIDFQTWWSSSGYGGTHEIYFRDAVMVPIGQPRSARPVIDCSRVLSSSTNVVGTHSETDPATVVRLYLAGIERGSDASTAGGAWDIGTFGPGTPFGQLYGGLEVRATAQAPGEAVSELSEPCFVTFVPQCSDGIDNDGDGVTDFPADPGCSSPADGSEQNPGCSDGMDNDGDLLVDWPADPECSGPDDTTEDGLPACMNGVDDDGDGAIDFPADTGCTDSSDRTEVTRRACGDGIDNDGDGVRDFRADGTGDPGCHSENDDSEANFAYLPGDVRPRILLVFDTSGSMNWNVCTDVFTGGDGSSECLGGDVSCGTCARGGNCGDMIANDSRIALARAGVSDVVAGFGDVELGLMRYHQRPTAFACPTTNATAASGGWAGAGSISGSCGATFSAGDLLVGFSPENEYSLLEWVDGSDNYAGTAPPGLDIELRGSGTTPIAGTLDSALTYLSDVRMDDTAQTCRPYRVILLTDGAETCGGDPAASAADLLTAGFPVNVIGFATRPELTDDLDAIATAGGTGDAILADDRVTLASAIATIVNDSILVEACNGADDDCDALVDEGFIRYCNLPSVPTQTLCADPGETLCDGIDNNCDGRIDEGLRNACGTCGAVPVEVCNGIDDDCDGFRDEGGVCAGCTPSAETCDNLDNDCDTRIDEGISRACGTDVGECTIGEQVCTAGVFGACSGVGPTAEECDGFDNDCDGVIDGLTMPCGSGVGACRTGTATCTAGMFGSCVGSIGPTMETCNNVDDDCNGVTDDGNPGGGAPCGSDIGACDPGTLQCMAGVLTCQGATGPFVEACNSTDDDCDGRTDESIPPGAACGACGDGRERCVGGMMTCTGDRTPGTEVCNGVDDDCDGVIDDGDPGAGDPCGTDEGECTPGTTACRGGRIECDGSIGPIAETCDSQDDDCDGLVDEGNPGGGGACGTTGDGECELGAEVCVAGSLVCVGESGPREERCDGLDNDCDGMIDEGNPGGGVACGDDTGECEAGITLCLGGSLVCDGEVGPTEEICDTLDNDCDGVPDDGLSLGAPCGTDQGECVPGILICQDGMTVCDGAIGPTDELCDALDNDCDSAVDEELPLGGECGDAIGACVPGMLQCVDGREVCVGEVPSTPEVCDCDDDDCDMAVDEGDLCGAGNRCINCGCAQPCTDSEFMPCPSGTTPVRQSDGQCFCEAPRCDQEECAGSTQMLGDAVLCQPDADGMSYIDEIPVCTCANNACVPPCDGVTCADGTVCHPHTGMCVVDDCTGLGCAMGEICDRVTRECVVDPCADAGCAADQACRAGVCETSCGDVSCGSSERCAGGECVVDLCAEIRCASGTVCDPGTGDCVTNMCVGVTCMAGTMCDPLTGDCERDRCLDLRCPAGDRCVLGECQEIPTAPDAGPPIDGGPPRDAGGGIDSGTIDTDPTTRVLAAGGGGCLCAVPGASPSRSSSGGLALFFAALGLVIVARRRGGAR